MLRAISSFSGNGGTAASSRSVRRYEGPPIRLLTFTWNVGNKMPNKEELHLWCPKDGGGFDLVVVGTQENSFTEKKKKKKKEQGAYGENSLGTSSDIDVELEDDDEDALMEEHMKAEEEAEAEMERLTAEDPDAAQRKSAFTKKKTLPVLHHHGHGHSHGHESGKKTRGKKQTARCDVHPESPADRPIVHAARRARVPREPSRRPSRRRGR